MANYTTLLKTWGDTGTEYPSGYSYLEGEQPVDGWDNFANHNIVEDLQHLVGLTNERIETDKGTDTDFPTSPEASHLYHDTVNESLHFYDTDASTWRRLLAEDVDEGNGSGLDADMVDGKDASELILSVEDNSVLVEGSASGINFVENLSVTDDGDGTVTVDAANRTDSEIQAQVRRNF